MHHKTWVHDRKGYVGFAIFDVEMAARHCYGIAAHRFVQIDSDHFDAAAEEMQIKLEPSNEPTLLLSLKLDVEAELGIRTELNLAALELLETILERI